MPRRLAQSEAPALLVLDGKPKLLAGQREQLVNYRLHGDRYIVDRVFDRAILVAGVGRKQTKIRIVRR